MICECCFRADCGFIVCVFVGLLGGRWHSGLYQHGPYLHLQPLGNAAGCGLQRWPNRHLGLPHTGHRQNHQCTHPSSLLFMVRHTSDIITQLSTLSHLIFKTHFCLKKMCVSSGCFQKIVPQRNTWTIRRQWNLKCILCSNHCCVLLQPNSKFSQTEEQVCDCM